MSWSTKHLKGHALACQMGNGVVLLLPIVLIDFVDKTDYRIALAEHERIWPDSSDRKRSLEDALIADAQVGWGNFPRRKLPTMRRSRDQRSTAVVHTLQ